MLNTHTIIAAGLPFVAMIIFAESGMLVGFFLPGDTLLLSLGIFVAQGQIPLLGTIWVIAYAAIAGDNIGYQIGRSLGPRLFSRPNSLIFRADHIARAERFFDRYGPKAMLFAHFVPVVRTFAPVAAGAGRMDRDSFFVYAALGDMAWATIMVLFGDLVASRIPGIESYVDPVLIGVVVLAIVPMLLHAVKSAVGRRREQQIRQASQDDTCAVAPQETPVVDLRAGEPLPVPVPAND